MSTETTETRPRFIENRTRAVAFTVMWAVVGYAAARWLWPWCGPWWLAPCPLATPAGCWVAAVVGAAWGFGKALELELAERRYVRTAAAAAVLHAHATATAAAAHPYRSER